MKKLLIAALLLVSGFTIKAQHEVSTDVLGYAFGRYGLGYEFLINDNNSVGLNFHYSTANRLWQTEKNSEGKDLIVYSEMNFIPEYKFFLTPNKGSDGFYVGVFAKYRMSNSTDNPFLAAEKTAANTDTLVSYSTDISTSSFSLGAMAGYKWKTNGRFFYEAQFGVGKHLVNNVSYSNEVANDDDKNATPEWDEKDYTPYLGNVISIDFRFAFKVGLRF